MSLGRVVAIFIGLEEDMETAKAFGVEKKVLA